MLFNPPWIAGHPAFHNKNTFGTYIHGACACQSSNQVWTYFCSTSSYHVDIFPLPGCSAPHAQAQIPDFPSVDTTPDWFSIFVAIGKLFRFPCPPWIASHPAFRNKNTFGTYIRGACACQSSNQVWKSSVQRHLIAWKAFLFGTLSSTSRMSSTTWQNSVMPAHSCQPHLLFQTHDDKRLQSCVSIIMGRSRSSAALYIKQWNLDEGNAKCAMCNATWATWAHMNYNYRQTLLLMQRTSKIWPFGSRFSGVSVGIDRKVTPYIAYTGFMISNMHVHSGYILCSTDGFVGYSTHIKGNSRNLTYTTLVQFSCKCKAKSSPTVTNQLLQSNPFPRRRSRAMLPIQDSYRRPPAWYVTPS